MGRATCEGCMSINARSWHRQGLLCAGQRFGHALTWMGEPTEGVDVVTEVDAVVLIFRSRSWGSKFGQIIRQRVPITWTLCSLGGRRPWFREPPPVSEAPPDPVRKSDGDRGRPTSRTVPVAPVEAAYGFRACALPPPAAITQENAPAAPSFIPSFFEIKELAGA
jgi:hypothetical protein